MAARVCWGGSPAEGEGGVGGRGATRGWGGRGEEEACGEEEGGNGGEARQELFGHTAGEGHRDAVAHQGRTVGARPTLGIADHLADDALQEGGATRA